MHKTRRVLTIICERMVYMIAWHSVGTQWMSRVACAMDWAGADLCELDQERAKSRMKVAVTNRRDTVEKPSYKYRMIRIRRRVSLKKQTKKHRKQRQQM